MYKLITLSTLLLGLALAPVLGGSVGQDRTGPAQTDSLHPDYHRDRVRIDRENSQGLSSQLDGPIASCEWSCEACEPDQGCTQTCTEIGNCGSTCNVISRCEVGFAWDEASCSCVN
ncbi:hypothetical protein DB30_03510 [Enhygromyxa salina]|uniref:Uncharacterized protein n=1 Tax=Enhygromyxa salina TaxID=215803 RepID=A0A0C2DBX5_9BACT|nr:hypothetical protein [Enhygromyxa salina]KIG17197.1 hypothetical protein DB30_03510 [Enhygromyxa salina]